ncbi:hypothetical protein CEXT_140981 [Caerostris extrusa]|uniref:Uncharacterized protein n=1 Tax=Caerostris extrusa TaxID=172846 RepID=A0AAV4QIX5_CAEEX|nr:hypothetical protein CEXT_140981 [Caerostris extrusa]
MVVQGLPENLLPFQSLLCDSFPASTSKTFKVYLHTIGPFQLGPTPSSSSKMYIVEYPNCQDEGSILQICGPHTSYVLS